VKEAEAGLTSRRRMAGTNHRRRQALDRRADAVRGGRFLEAVGRKPCLPLRRGLWSQAAYIRKDPRGQGRQGRSPARRSPRAADASGRRMRARRTRARRRFQVKRSLALALALALAHVSCAAASAPRELESAPRSALIVPRGFVVVPLESISAEHVAETIEELIDESARLAFERSRGSCVLYRPDAWPPKPEPAVRIFADPATNSVLVKASPDDLPRLLELIARLDGKLR
jgi:hypothetical protein